MFDLTALDFKEVASVVYTFNNEELNLEIRDPTNIEVLPTGHHVITDCEGVFVISPTWVYFSIVKRNF